MTGPARDGLRPDDLGPDGVQHLGGLRYTVLGPVRAWRSDTELVLGPPQQRAVLALLLIHAGHPVPLNEIVDVLWREEPPGSSANVVHRQVGALRRLLEPGLRARESGRLLTRSAGGYRLDAEGDASDLHRFRRLRAEAGKAAEVADWGRSVRLFAAALALRRGPVATGSPSEVLGHPVFTAVEEEYLDTVKAAADLALRHDSPAGLLAVLRESAARHPLDESLQTRLVLALGAAGHQAEALDAYQAIRSRLAEELGIDPGAELRDAQERVLRQRTRPATATGGTTDGATGGGEAGKPGRERDAERPSGTPAPSAPVAPHPAMTSYGTPRNGSGRSAPSCGPPSSPPIWPPSPAGRRSWPAC